MSNVSSSNPSDLRAAFERGFNGMPPAEEPKQLLAERLEPLRDLITARRRYGYSWTQITEVLAKLGITVSHVTVRRLFSEQAKKAARPPKRVITSVRVLPPDGAPIR
jgi:hypothetical protein